MSLRTTISQVTTSATPTISPTGTGPGTTGTFTGANTARAECYFLGGSTTIATGGKLEFNLSTPAAGHDKLDLAATRTKALRDGDVYRVTGTKVWTSFAHEADYVILFCRTSGTRLGPAVVRRVRHAPPQQTLALDERRGSDGIARCALVLDAEVIRTEGAARRPFQGWRYLDPADSPRDLPKGRALDDKLPPSLAQALAEIGLR